MLVCVCVTSYGFMYYLWFMYFMSSRHYKNATALGTIMREPVAVNTSSKNFMYKCIVKFIGSGNSLLNTEHACNEAFHAFLT